ncbi:MAG: phenylalanine--tRNA ligase subunit alpha [Candidatus Marsarchaeota archaeon]|nr:phenylalanine--tRNA ligase subunit alpha [Candidatus Marsarchaeota archaeon]
MHRYETAVLSALKGKHKMQLEELMASSGLGRDEVLWALENLASRSCVRVEKAQTHDAELSQEGKEYAESALPEELLLKRLGSGDLMAAGLSAEERIGLQWCLRLGLASVNHGVVKITAKGKSHGAIRESAVLRELNDNPESYDRLLKTDGDALKKLESRGLIKSREKSRIKSITITPAGLDAETGAEDGAIGVVTRDVIAGRSWESRPFKRYDVSVDVEGEPMAVRHPLRRVINEVKDIYARMGFTEISGPVVEPSFWVFDSLFVPQDHPAREAQDTFHVSNPEFLPVEEDEYLRAVRKAHTGSWKSEWRKDEAERTVLSTHMTNVSVRYIRDFVKKVIDDKAYEPRLPLKLFSVGRIFRNENIDFKHLADFYQTDGIIIGKRLTLANLFDTLIELYGQLGFKVRFKPAYFPFVEPGAEIFIYSERHKNWLEVGGSGIIRAEVTSLPRNRLTVLAWGLGIERILLLRDSSISGINELYNNGVGWLRSRRM